MKLRQIGAALAVCAISLPGLAGASTLTATFGGDYFVRPFVQVEGGGLIDGLIQNGSTSSSQNFTSYASAVDLDDGTVKAFVEAPAANQFRQAGGSFGETLEFQNAVGETIDFSFSFDGNITVSDLLPGPLASGYSATVYATLFVYDAAAGADWSNFTSLGGALIGESTFTDYGTSSGGTPTETVFGISDTLSGSIMVEANKRYEVFASPSVAAVANSNPISIEMDFDDTGTFGIAAPQGVTYLSGSGTFLNSAGQIQAPPAIPLPAAGWLLISGLAGLVGFGRRSRGVSKSTTVVSPALGQS